MYQRMVVKSESAMCSGLRGWCVGSEDLQLSSLLVVGKFVPTIPPTNFPQCFWEFTLSIFLQELFSVCLRLWQVLTGVSNFYAFKFR